MHYEIGRGKIVFLKRISSNIRCHEVFFRPGEPNKSTNSASLADEANIEGWRGGSESSNQLYPPFKLDIHQFADGTACTVGANEPVTRIVALDIRTWIDRCNVHQGPDLLDGNDFLAEPGFCIVLGRQVLKQYLC